MTTVISGEQIFDVVQEAIVLALAIEPDQVTAEARLLDDLGAESIDFLDITFRLEQVLPIRIPRDDLVEQFEEVLGEETVVDATRLLTPLGAHLIRERLTGVDSSRLRPGLPVDEVVSLWTVQTWIDLATRLVGSVPDKCADCGGEPVAARTDAGSYLIRCAACSAEIHTVPGDVLNEQWLKAERDKPAVIDLLAESAPADRA